MDIRKDRAAIEAIERGAEEFHQAYMDDPDFLDRHYGVPSLGDLLADPEVVGASRFIEHPSFNPEELYTFVFRPTTIEISAVIGDSELWASMPVVYSIGGIPYERRVREGEPFDPKKTWRKSAVCDVRSKMCPPLFRSWETLRAASANAGSCMTDTLDGITYRHRLADRQFRSDADWYNPALPENASQIAIVDAYERLLRNVGLYQEGQPVRGLLGSLFEKVGRYFRRGLVS